MAFAVLQDNDDNPETALVALYAAGDNKYTRQWNMSETSSVRSFVSPAAEYLHNWHYTETKPRVRFHQGYYFFNGRVIEEDVMDEALRMTREKLERR